MERLIEAARKMEEQSATPQQLARGIITSYKHMDRQRDHLLGNTGLIEQKTNKQIIPSVISANNTNKSITQSKQSSVNRKLNKSQANNNEPSKFIDVIHQRVNDKMLKHTNSKQHSQIVHQQKSKKVAIRFKDQDKEFQIFSLKLLSQKLNKLRLLIGRQHVKQSMNVLKAYFNAVTQRENQFILKRARNLMAKYFGLLYKQTIILRLERENEQTKKEIMKQKQQQQAAEDFYEFSLYQKAMRSWKRYTKLIRNQRRRIDEQTNEALNRQKELPVSQPPLSELKSKVSDFLNNIKRDIEGQNKKATIPPPQIIVEEEEIEISQVTHSDNLQPINPSNEESEEQIQDINIEPSMAVAPNSNIEPSTHIPGKKLTHEQLLKKRDELERKNKQRKQRLEQIRKQKEQQRLKLQEERRLSEQRMKEEQAKRKQEQYQKFLKRKKEEQLAKENEIKQIQRQQRLHEFAEAQDKMRLKKFFGIQPWKRLILLRNSNVLKVGMCYVKRVIKVVLVEVPVKEQKKFRVLELRADNLRRKHCKRHTLAQLKQFIEVTKEEKLDLLSRHCLHTQRIAFKGWMRSMNVIRQQNYQEEKIITAKVEIHRNDFLLAFCFRALARNKEQQKRNRNINEHKNNLKGKISEWIKNDSEINVDKLLQ